jgi:hypothetical protein
MLSPIPDQPGVRKILQVNRNIVEDAPPTLGPAVGQRPVRKQLFDAYNTGGTVPTDHAQASARFKGLARSTQNLGVKPELEDHLVTMFLCTQGRLDAPGLQTRSEKDKTILSTLAEQLFPNGLGPRAIIGLSKAAKAWALLFDESKKPVGALEAGPSHLAKVVLPVLRHCARLPTDWERLANGELMKRVTHLYPLGRDPLVALLAFFCDLTMPTIGEYPTLLRGSLQQETGR